MRSVLGIADTAIVSATAAAANADGGVADITSYTIKLKRRNVVVPFRPQSALYRPDL